MDTTQDIKDIKPPVDLPANHWLLWVVCIVAVTVVAVLVYRYFKNRKKKFLGAQMADWQIALSGIDALLKKQWGEQGKLAEFFGELSLILRRYIEQRFKIEALEMTTEELLLDVKNKNQFQSAHQQVLTDFLQLSDQVKFAKHIPSKGDAERALDLVRRFIEETKMNPESSVTKNAVSVSTAN